MTDQTPDLVLPPEAADYEKTIAAAATAVGSGEVDIPVPALPAAPVVSTTGKHVSVALNAEGTPVVTVPLTKKTKAHIGTGLAVLSLAGEIVSQILPGTPETLWIQVGIGVVGSAAVYLGVVLPTNLPINVKSIVKK